MKESLPRKNCSALLPHSQSTSHSHGRFVNPLSVRLARGPGPVAEPEWLGSDAETRGLDGLRPASGNSVIWDVGECQRWQVDMSG